LEKRDLDAVRGRLQDLDSLGRVQLAPCHLDFSPRNWLVEDALVNVIDFEWVALDYWACDLGRLYVGPWRGHPELQDAFLDGYGRRLEVQDLAVLQANAALTAVRLIVWANEHGESTFAMNCRENLNWLLRRTT
jgi:thiamine kinase-like enzyme